MQNICSTYAMPYLNLPNINKQLTFISKFSKLFYFRGLLTMVFTVVFEDRCGMNLGSLSFPHMMLSGRKVF